MRRLPAALTLILVILLLAAIPALAAPPRILALGDSLTAGFGLPAEQAFPMRLQARLAALGVPVEIVNAGVSGDTTAGGLARLDWALADHPGFVILALGANDALRGAQSRPRLRAPVRRHLSRARPEIWRGALSLLP
jgi:acyl-CoA thioesterase-1